STTFARYCSFASSIALSGIRLVSEYVSKVVHPELVLRFKRLAAHPCAQPFPFGEVLLGRVQPVQFLMRVNRYGHDIVDAVYPLRPELGNLGLFNYVMPMHSLGSRSQIPLQLPQRRERRLDQGSVGCAESRARAERRDAQKRIRQGRRLIPCGRGV